MSESREIEVQEATAVDDAPKIEVNGALLADGVDEKLSLPPSIDEIKRTLPAFLAAILSAKKEVLSPTVHNFLAEKQREIVEIVCNKKHFDEFGNLKVLEAIKSLEQSDIFLGVVPLAPIEWVICGYHLLKIIARAVFAVSSPKNTPYPLAIDADIEVLKKEACEKKKVVKYEGIVINTSEANVISAVAAIKAAQQKGASQTIKIESTLGDRVAAKTTPSPIPTIVSIMQEEIDRQKENLDRINRKHRFSAVLGVAGVAGIIAMAAAKILSSSSSAHPSYSALTTGSVNTVLSPTDGGVSNIPNMQPELADAGISDAQTNGSIDEGIPDAQVNLAGRNQIDAGIHQKPKPQIKGKKEKYDLGY